MSNSDQWSEDLRKEVERLRLLSERRRLKDNYRLPSGIYEIVQDHALIEAALKVMGRIWNKENDDYRKAAMHLTKLEWDLRKRLQDLL